MNNKAENEIVEEDKSPKNWNIISEKNSRDYIATQKVNNDSKVLVQKARRGLDTMNFSVIQRNIAFTLLQRSKFLE